MRKGSSSPLFPVVSLEQWLTCSRYLRGQVSVVYQVSKELYVYPDVVW